MPCKVSVFYVKGPHVHYIYYLMDGYYLLQLQHLGPIAAKTGLPVTPLRISYGQSGA